MFLSPYLSSDYSISTNEKEIDVNEEASNSTRKIQLAAVAIVTREQKFLTIKRSATVRAPGKICFPGGGIEPGETADQAAVREMREELNVEIKPISFVWKSSSPRGFELYWWRCELLEDQTIVPNLEEVESFHWMTQAEMVAEPELLDTNDAFFKALNRGEFQLDY